MGVLAVAQMLEEGVTVHPLGSQGHKKEGALGMIISRREKPAGETEKL